MFIDWFCENHKNSVCFVNFTFWKFCISYILYFYNHVISTNTDTYILENSKIEWNKNVKMYPTTHSIHKHQSKLLFRPFIIFAAKQIHIEHIVLFVNILTFSIFQIVCGSVISSFPSLFSKSLAALPFQDYVQLHPVSAYYSLGLSPQRCSLGPAVLHSLLLRGLLCPCHSIW